MRTLGVVLVVLGTWGCHGPDVRLSEPSRIAGRAEALVGTDAADAIERRFGGVVRDADAEARMNRIASALKQASDRRSTHGSFRLLASASLNAISLPGGRIYVTRGLYAQFVSDDQLAAVLAHEMAHVAARDNLKPRSRSSQEALHKELAADAQGSDLLRLAGFSTSAMTEVISVIKDVQPPGWAEARLGRLSRQEETAP